MNSGNSLYQQLRSHLAYLKMAAAAEALPAALDRAAASGQTHTEFLEELLAVEVDATEARRLAGRMRFANFPAPWRIADFDFSAQPSIDPALIRDLATCRYTADATNILFIGPPGVGKTMLAVAPGREAVEAGQRVLHHRRRPRRPLPQSRHRGPLGCHHAILRRARRAHHRRARLPAHAHRRRQRLVPGHPPEAASRAPSS